MGAQIPPLDIAVGSDAIWLRIRSSGEPLSLLPMATSDILGDDFFAYLKQAQQATQKAGGDLEEMMSSIKNDLETIEDQNNAPVSPSCHPLALW